MHIGIPYLPKKKKSTLGNKILEINQLDRLSDR
jgi:hypothetical protein